MTNLTPTGHISKTVSVENKEEYIKGLHAALDELVVQNRHVIIVGVAYDLSPPIRIVMMGADDQREEVIKATSMALLDASASLAGTVPHGGH